MGVCCIPGIPYSASYCLKCLEGNAHPWWALVATAMGCNGLKNCNEGFLEMVRGTCVRLGKTQEEFEAEVNAALAKMEADEDEVLSKP